MKHASIAPLTGRFRQRLVPYRFIAPFFLVFTAFLLYPLLESFRLSTLDFRLGGDESFIGAGNLKVVLGDGRFWQATLNTFYFAVGSLLTQVPVALGLALLVNAKRVRGKAVWRTVFFLPTLFSVVALAFLFRAVYAPYSGLLARLTGVSLPWLDSAHLVMPALLLAACWKWSGLHMVFLLAGLQTIPEELYEAAAVDGANWWDKLWHITLPGLKPFLVFVVTMSLIGSFQLFELPYIMTQGGPDGASRTLVQWLYERGISSGDYGYAATVGWVLLFLIAAVTFIQLRGLGEWGRGGEGR